MWLSNEAIKLNTAFCIVAIFIIVFAVALVMVYRRDQEHLNRLSEKGGLIYSEILEKDRSKANEH